MRLSRFWRNILFAAYCVSGPVAAAAQDSPIKDERSAWATCRKAPTPICLIDEATSIAQNAGDSTVLVLIGRAQAKAALKDQAAATFQRALTTTQSPGLETVRGLLIAGVALAQAEAGLKTDAAASFALATKLANSREAGRAVQLEVVGVRQAQAGFVAEAQELAQSKTTAMLSLISTQADLGKFPDAIALARSLDDKSPLRPIALYGIVKAQAKAGRIGEATELAQIDRGCGTACDGSRRDCICIAEMMVAASRNSERSLSPEI